MHQGRSRHARDTRWPQPDPFDLPDDDDDVPDDDRLVPVDQARAPVDPRAAFTPEPVERFTAYATASRRSYDSLLGALADLSSRQGGLRAAADARIRLMGAHLAEVGQLRDFYGIAR